MVRRHDVVCARFCLSYKLLCQANQVSAPVLCVVLLTAGDCNTIVCTALDDLVPRGVQLIEVCRLLLTARYLDVVMGRLIGFEGC